MRGVRCWNLQQCLRRIHVVGVHILCCGVVQRAVYRNQLVHRVCCGAVQQCYGCILLVCLLLVLSWVVQHAVHGRPHVHRVRRRILRQRRGRYYVSSVYRVRQQQL